jgi:hypothetical protein
MGHQTIVRRLLEIEKQMIESQNHSPGDCCPNLTPFARSSGLTEDPQPVSEVFDLNRSVAMVVRDSQNIGSLED